ncbi:MAG: hypothetical protein J3K34DRAFT_190574 [Monoraphidium minutum]|nr:MAG: hypothetical protein J3K34DRAFT_190574 [Monoraphidium minutum]
MCLCMCMCMCGRMCVLCTSAWARARTKRFRKPCDLIARKQRRPSQVCSKQGRGLFLRPCAPPGCARAGPSPGARRPRRLRKLAVQRAARAVRPARGHSGRRRGRRGARAAHSARGLGLARSGAPAGWKLGGGSGAIWESAGQFVVRGGSVAQGQAERAARGSAGVGWRQGRGSTGGGRGARRTADSPPLARAGVEQAQASPSGGREKVPTR